MSAAPQVIVVGSGPAGVSAAWPLVRAGIHVRMIDASSGVFETAPASRSLAQFRTDPMSWKDRFGADFSMLRAPKDLSPKIATPNAQHTLSGFVARSGVETDNFCAMGSLACGGLSNIWGALALPFEEDELAESAFDAVAMRRSYRAVARRIGISGGSGAEPETLSSAPARRLLARHRQRGTHRGFDLEAAANAVLHTAQGDRLPCSRCGLCLYGCSRGSIYNSATELPALRRFANFSYASGHFVQAIRTDGTEQVLDVEVGGSRRQLRAAIVVLAAGTLATTGLALRRIGWIDRPVRLLTNPLAAAAFIMPGLIGRAPPDQSFALGQLFYRLRGADGGAAGVVYGADALPLHLLAARLPLGRPFALRLAHALAPALLMTTCYLPGSFSQNHLCVHGRDNTAGMSIAGVQTASASMALRAAVRELKREFGKLGAIPVPGSVTLLQPGADAHYAGTLPMGGSGPIATTRSGELRGCPGLFIADGACLPHLPATHPTLTIMANADRIGHELANRLRGQDADAASVSPLTAAL
jgi:choline dehydrogenase-like flavoprotein